MCFLETCKDKKEGQWSTISHTYVIINTVLLNIVHQASTFHGL